MSRASCYYMHLIERVPRRALVNMQNLPAPASFSHSQRDSQGGVYLLAIMIYISSLQSDGVPSPSSNVVSLMLNWHTGNDPLPTHIFVSACYIMTDTC